MQTDQGVLSCKARGRFRKEKLTPIVGDHVTALPTEADPTEGSIVDILPRKNSFVRPPVSNIDQMLITIAAADPEPDLMLVDKLLVTALHAGVSCAICINKTDLASEADVARYRSIYQQAGFPVFCISATHGTGVDALSPFLAGKVTALSGNSGVGKSSLLNALGCDVETGTISDRTHHGRHTTRHVELLSLPSGGLVLDTPGFSSYEVDHLRHTELARLFPEFAPYLGGCRFAGCSHVSEPDCAVKEAVSSGNIAPSRYENYVALYQTLKEIKEWMRNE